MHSHGYAMDRGPRVQHTAARNGFTLTEVLVVIGIIGVLLGVILPALSSMQRQSRATVCLNNMRQIGVAHGIYMNFNNDRFVDAGLPHGGQTTYARYSWLFALARIDPGLVSVLQSPADRSRFWTSSEGGLRDDAWTLSEAIDLFENNPNAIIAPSQIARWSSYGLNDMLIARWAPMLPDPTAENGFREANWTRLSRVPRPSKTVHFVMMTDGDYSSYAESYAMSDHIHVQWDSPHAEAPALASNYMQAHAHGGRAGTWSATANYGFLDGSIATLEFHEVYQSATDNNFIPDYAR